MSQNALTITGNLVADPEKVEYGDGNVLANIRIAVSERTGRGDAERTGFYDVTAFGSLGQNVLNSLHKGDRVVVAGRLDHQTFERADGSKGGRVKVIANTLGAEMSWASVQVTKNQRS